MTGLSSSTFGDLGGAVSDIFGAVGDLSEASAYGKAAAIDQQNAAIAAASGKIQQVQSQRQIYQSIGGTRADVSGAGFAQSGSSLDIVRSSLEQGALQKALIANQTSINVNGYEAEAASYQGRQAAAQAGAAGGFLGGLLKIGAAIAPLAMASDARLKRDIKLIGLRPDGIGHYTFRYLDSDQLYQGVLAQEVAAVFPAAIQMRADGFMMVDYAMIGERMMEVGHA